MTHRRTLRAALVATLTFASLAGAAGSASAATTIEGVWSFNGGRVADQQKSGGTFVGTVVAPTKFDQCTHEVGEQMWTGMTPQPDGSYWGSHQWFQISGAEECAPIETLGPTAWRVLSGRGGSHFLRVCFSEPDGTQPTIAPNGTSAQVSFKCDDSALVAPLPEGEVGGFLSLPSNSACLARKRLKIRLRDPQNDPWKKVVVGLRSGTEKRQARIKRHPRSVVATLDLRGLSTRRFTVTVHATTVLGSHLFRKRTYSSCAAAKRHRGKKSHGRH